MMIMLHRVIKTSYNIDDLIENVEKFMSTKVYYYNCFISKYIWINYGVGIVLYGVNIYYGGGGDDESSVKDDDDELVRICNRVLYLMILRIVVFIVKIQTDSRGLTEKEI